MCISKHIPLLHPSSLFLSHGGENRDKYKRWDGCVEENYLPEPLGCCQHEDIHLFCTENDSWLRLRGERGGVREQKRVSESIASFEQEAGRENGREAGEPQHLKVLNL